MVSPDRLGRYEIRGVLGSGAMGAVYTAWDPELERSVAIKIIKASDLTEYALRRFRREAQALARLTHRNIVAVHDIGHHAGAPFIVMELVEGVTLASQIASGVSRPLLQKLELIAQVCDALAFAHSHGIIHRDVKPGNILITPNGAAKLADFGLARLQSSSLTITADVVGTPAYLAPEAFAGEDLDARADVYGIAASLFEWVSGSRPHEADHLATLMARVLAHDAPDVRTKWPGCPAPLAECLSRGLARDRSRRFQTASEFATALREIVDAGSAADHVPTVVVQGVSHHQPRDRRRMVAAAAVLAAVLGAMAVNEIVSAPPGNTAPSTASAVTTAPAAVGDTSSVAPPAAPQPMPVAPNPDRRPVPTVTGASRDISEPTAIVAPDQTEDDEGEALPAAIPIGTRVLIAVQTVLRTDRTDRGARFDGVLVEPLMLNGRVVAPASSAVQGIVDLVIPGGSNRAPSMQLSLTSIEVGGTAMKIRTARYEVVAPAAEGGSSVSTLIIGAVGGAVIGGVVGGGQGAAAGAALGAAAGSRPATRGEYVLGDRLTFKLAEPLRLQPGTD